MHCMVLLCRQLLPGREAAEGGAVQAELLLRPPHELPNGVSTHAVLRSTAVVVASQYKYGQLGQPFK